jgi:hypothetical protein
MRERKRCRGLLDEPHRHAPDGDGSDGRNGGDGDARLVVPEAAPTQFGLA